VTGRRNLREQKPVSRRDTWGAKNEEKGNLNLDVGSDQVMKKKKKGKKGKALTMRPQGVPVRNTGNHFGVQGLNEPRECGEGKVEQGKASTFVTPRPISRKNKKE